ncbi:3-phosphoshikimate 1-carboxyvinyltransferase [hot springs metagenome]|uniref:3-phosphoshikimate 1-carboxyvinyltransferase n=1 Tax=hot springs metagenome TaxID=433727 RepID=A0A5J4KZZ6_9ZZZZ
MNQIKLYKAKSLRGEITPPPDKSITHRAIMFTSLADGKSIIRNPLLAEDPVSTMNAMRALGVTIEAEGLRLKAEGSGQKIKNQNNFGLQPAALIVHGKGLHGLREPFDVINCGNSGTTARLISGILAGNPFFSVLTGDDSLKQRPMARVINPLRKMGARIMARHDDKYLPMAIKGGGLKAIRYEMPVASAQVKSCLILAGLYAEGTTEIIEPQKSRDHTERMLRAMGAEIKAGEEVKRLRGEEEKLYPIHPFNHSPLHPFTTSVSLTSNLKPFDITVPGDFSSAAFFIVGALIVPHSEVLIRNVVLNPTRTGLLDVIKEMGSDLEIDNIRDVSGEPVGDIYVKTADSLKAVKIARERIPSLIDEFPVLCILATQADGITEIRGAEELRIKESDRIKAMATQLKKLGIELEEYPDGIAIKGKTSLKGAIVESYHDHRIAMSLAIAALVAEGVTTIDNASCVDISFPGFFEELKRLYIAHG